MDILDHMGVSKLSAKVVVFFKVNYSFKSAKYCGIRVTEPLYTSFIS